MKRFLLFLLLVVIVSACSKHPDQISTMFVPTSRFKHMPCEELTIEKDRIEQILPDLIHKQEQAAGVDAALAVGGSCLFFPLLFAIPFGPDYEQEISNLKGDLNAIEAVYDMKNCWKH